MRVLYARYNRHRLPEFQLQTSVLQKDGKLVVEKRAITKAACPHIATLIRLHRELEPMARTPLRQPAILNESEDAVQFEFVRAPRLDGLWMDAFFARDKDAFVSMLDDYHRFLVGGFPVVDKFNVPQATRDVFDGVDLDALAQERLFLERSFLDPIPDNILVKDGSFYVVDNEWAVEGSLPVSYVLYRGLFEFFVLKCSGFGLESFFSFEEALSRYGIAGALANMYRSMEEGFQNYVCGPSKLHYAKLAYARPVMTLAGLDQSLRMTTLDVLSHIQTIQEKDKVIAALMEDKKKVIHILESDEWEWAQKLRLILDRYCPLGTRRRALALRLLNGLAGPERVDDSGLKVQQ